MPVSHHSVFYRPDALPAMQPTAVSKVGQNFGALDPIEGEIFWGDEIFYPLLWYLYAKEISASNLVNQSDKSRLYSTESADSTSKTDDRLN